MIEIIKIVLELLALLLPFAIDWKEQQPNRETNNNVEDARKALAKDNGDRFDAIAADQHDRVLNTLRRHTR